MNTKNKVVRGLAGLLVASGIAGFDSGCATGNVEHKDFGTNIYSEPSYVTKHFWTSPCGDNDWTRHYDRDIEKTRNGKYPNVKFNRYDDNLEEYIELKDGNALGVLVTDNDVFLKFYEGNNSVVINKKDVEDQKTILSDSQNKLYELVRLNESQISKIRKVK